MAEMFSRFIADFSGFLFEPFQAAQAARAESRPPQPLPYVIYITIMLGVAMWFLVFYQEPLYYPVSAGALQKEVPAIVVSDPRLSLLLVLAGTAIFVAVLMYLLPGLIGHAILRRVAGPQVSLRNYLSFYAYTLSPLLLFVPLIALRIFFFEKWVMLKPLYPFVDLTVPNLVQLCITAGLIGWKYFIELRLNQALFRVGWKWALAPIMIQLALAIILLWLPVLLNPVFFEAMKDTLA